MPFPVNFSTKLKEAKAIDGKGYPYAIKAEDLMKNFAYAKLDVDQTVHSSGLQLIETNTFWEDGYNTRRVELRGELNGANMDMAVTDYQEDTLGIMVATGSATTHYWRKGLYIGTTDPLDYPAVLITESVSNIIPAS